MGGAVGTFGGLFHLLNHALAKSLAFFAAGNIRRRFMGREIKEVQGLFEAQPLTAAAILIAGLALVGMPPFSMFASEVLVVSALATQSFASDTVHFGRLSVPSTIANEVRNVCIVMVFLAVQRGVVRWFYLSSDRNGMGEDRLHPSQARGELGSGSCVAWC